MNTLRYCALTVLNTAGYCYMYDEWSDEFCREELREAKNCSAKKITLQELIDTPLQELYDYGFCKWSEESNLLLFPIWVVPFIDPDIEVTSISDDTDQLKNVDLDARFGCIAWGIKH